MTTMEVDSKLNVTDPMQYVWREEHHAIMTKLTTTEVG